MKTPMDIREHPMIMDGPRDLRDMVVEQCLCGSELFYAIVQFNDKEISGYYTQAVCYMCGRWVTLPTMIDES